MNGEQVADELARYGRKINRIGPIDDEHADTFILEWAGLGEFVINNLPTILQHLRAQTGWRNMDSAPKDGTFVHLWVPADERSGGYSETGSWCKTANAWDIGAARQPDSMFTHWRPEFPPPGDAP